MPSLFRKPKVTDPLDQVVEEAAREQDYRARIPASARVNDGERFTPLQLTEELDDDDEDLEFLSSIARAAKTDAPAPPRSTPRAKVARVTLPAEKADDLAAFRDIGNDDERRPISKVIAMPDVEIADLLDDLGETMAALRRRRAA